MRRGIERKRTQPVTTRLLFASSQGSKRAVGAGGLLKSKPAHLSRKTPCLFSLIESLSDISPYARQRAAEDLSRMCIEGNRDPRMLSSLVATLDDSDASVRSAVAIALRNLGDRASVEPLKRRLEVEESLHVRPSLERALERLDE
jgi:hypothetical protein